MFGISVQLDRTRAFADSLLVWWLKNRHILGFLISPRVVNIDIDTSLLDVDMWNISFAIVIMFFCDHFEELFESSFKCRGYAHSEIMQVDCLLV